MLVAVAEDDPDLLFLLRSYLSDLGHEVDDAANGVDALALVRRRRPDVLLLDRTMPGQIDGLDVLREIRADPDLGDLPVALLTARHSTREIEAALAEGADAYLVKPFAMTELVTLLADVSARGPG